MIENCPLIFCTTFETHPSGQHVAILLGSSAGWYPTLTAIHAVLGTNVALLLGWGIPGAGQTGYRPLHAVVIGITDAALGLLVILANVLLK